MCSAGISLKGTPVHAAVAHPGHRCAVSSSHPRLELMGSWLALSLVSKARVLPQETLMQQGPAFCGLS